MCVINKTQSEIEIQARNEKKEILGELIDFFTTAKWWNEIILSELIDAVSANIFRSLPHGNPKTVKGDEDEQPFQDPQWEHLSLIYELSLRFLIASDIDKQVCFVVNRVFFLFFIFLCCA